MIKILKKEQYHNNTPPRRIVLPEPIKPHHFKPGVSGNPAGRPKETIGVKEMKKYTRETLALFLNEMLQMPLGEARAVLIDDTAPLVKRAIAKALIIGDWTDVDKVFDRVVGKVPQKVIGEGFENDMHTHLHLGEKTKNVTALGDRIKTLANTISSHSSR